MKDIAERKRIRKSGRDISLEELQKMDFLNGVQAAKYCGMAPRTFYYYLTHIDIPKYVRQTLAKRPKVLYSRTDLDVQLRPMAIMERISNNHRSTNISDRKKEKCSCSSR